ncbi:MAG: hypothetical protein CFH06_00053 [Alphaproteobacteria bacterium MarineAlpha3_Bin5]|nr:hypothetical protein [Magnetovibrio sp.]PPR80166.1 MAG: hypothetical protein CFH06_00053 [Alphaproteobacteria bacterium MarineAlpha3_Bin5]|tara:strand:- start:370 stop:555 length:186 start_codon:yes stop_codon:yes gene_type:complete
MSDLIAALGLAIVIEGFIYALFPNRMKKLMEQILEQPQDRIRSAGLVAAAFGVVVIWLVRG